ncbi:MAG: phosphatidylinositol kinase, partial [bacterium]|nr:phosphatidylinositol kinase [bacterium]
FIINSTDRKGGHILLGDDGRLYAIDNGLSFHCEFKLRTVIWEWAGDPLPADLAADVARMIDGGLPADVADLLTLLERDAVLARASALVGEACFPTDPSGRRHPWPLV